MYPFHALVYILEGELKASSQPDKLPTLDSKEYGLQALVLETYRGFLFLRFESGPQLFPAS